MLKRMILINSANFQFADIDLSKEVFFVGDNASGKTTSTRALHFLYNSDGQKLGIPRGKDSFAKHYFPSDDSYIIYVFQDFFIFTYSRNNTIRRWFSKQIFDIESLINKGELQDFKDIEKYIKSASLFYKPSTIDEYTSILYGDNRKYLDFSIAKIENYKIFLDIFNMIFNIDKAIVTASDIKKAIQKSLDRKDEVLSIDYEDFIRKLNGFSRSYHFFKIFDSNRENLIKALSLKEMLLKLEKTSSLTTKAINYRYVFEIEELNKQKKAIEKIDQIVKKNKDRQKSIHKLFEKFDSRISEKIKVLSKEITILEILKEKFDPIDIADNTLIANKQKSIKEELDSKKISLYRLKERQTSVQKEIENEINQIQHKIKNHIPNEMKQTVYELSEIEKSNHESERLEIIKEFDILENDIEQKIRDTNYEIDNLSTIKIGIDSEILSEQNRVKQVSKNEIEPLELQKKIYIQKLKTIESKSIEVGSKKNNINSKIDEHNNKYQKLRQTNAKMLSAQRSKFNNKILNARAILNPQENSFHEFLSNEIDGWEEDVYPIIDKDLLKISCDELKPQIIDEKTPIGFKVNTLSLQTLPTKDEALNIIQSSQNEKYRLLVISKEIYKAEVAKLDEVKNDLDAELESTQTELDNLIDDKSLSNAEIEKIVNAIDEKQNELLSLLESIEESSREKREMITNKVNLKQKEIKSCKDDLTQNNKDKNNTFKKNDDKRDFNIDIIEKQEIRKAKQEIGVLKSKIDTLSKNMDSLDEDDLIHESETKIELLEDAFKEANDAVRFLEEYEEKKDDIKLLPIKEILLYNVDKLLVNRKKLIKRVDVITEERRSEDSKTREEIDNRLKKYNLGINKVKNKNIIIGDEKLESEVNLTDLIDDFEYKSTEYRNEKSKFGVLLDKLKKLESHSIIELNFNMEKFSEVKSINELEYIMDSLDELSDFEKNKYESEKKRSHNNFDTFIRLTIPSKIQSFDDLENEFRKAKTSINKTLSRANFGVIRDIELIMDSSKKRNDSLSFLLQELSKKVQDTVGLYSNKSLFYFDISKSVGNIEDIQSILEQIRKKGSNGAINLFDTIDLSISYVENGKKVENKLNIKDESSSGGNILLKVAIAMSVLSRYAKKTSTETPFFLIIDEVSKLQSKNQDLIREYINKNGFKTLFITPDPAYPDPKRAIYYTFKNIQEEGETLEIRQMNIV